MNETLELQNSPAVDARCVWMIVGDKLGDNAQVNAVASAIGWPVEVKRQVFLPQFVTGKPPFKASLYHIDQEKSDPLTAPWPDLILTVGRRPSMAALWTKEQSAGTSKVVLVGRPRRMLEAFDLVLAPPHYLVPERPNVHRLPLPLLFVDRDAIEAAKIYWSKRWRDLPRPLTAVLVGGPTKPFRFDAAVARRMAELLAKSVGSEGTIFVSTSRRTPEDVIDALEHALPENSFVYRWSATSQDNPYLGLLGHADRAVVTGDSVSMMVEVSRLGKPLAIFPLPIASPGLLRARRFASDIFVPERPRGGVRTPLEWVGEQIADSGVFGYAREFDRLYATLIENGAATMLGDGFKDSTASFDEDLSDIANRIRNLFLPNVNSKAAMNAPIQVQSPALSESRKG
jgi:mitochondrial fission protein ELM1